MSVHYFLGTKDGQVVEVDEEEAEREPSEPVMELSEWNLPANKNVVVLLLDKSGKNEKEKKETADHLIPVHHTSPCLKIIAIYII